MWPLWIAWQRDAETAAGKLERYSAPKDLAVRGECLRADIYIYLCLFVFTLILLRMKWHIFVYVPTPVNSFNHVYIRSYSKFYLCTYEYISLYIHINYTHACVHLSSYLHIIFHIYTSYTSASLKWPAFWIRTILIVDSSPPPPNKCNWRLGTYSLDRNSNFVWLAAT